MGQDPTEGFWKVPKQAQEQASSFRRAGWLDLVFGRGL